VCCRPDIAPHHTFVIAIAELSLNTGLSWGSGALVTTSAFTVILGLCMLALGVGRGLIAYQADRTGERGGVGHGLQGGVV
jgi:hypothetical protein